MMSLVTNGLGPGSSPERLVLNGLNAVLLVTRTRRLVIEGISQNRMVIDGMSEKRFSVDGISKQRMTIEGSR